MKRVRLFAPACAVALLCSACGYNLVGYGGQFPAGVESLAVPIFENRTKDVEIARTLTNHFVRELLATGKVRVVPPEEADAEVRGIVTRYEIEPITFDAQRDATENRLLVSTDISLVLKGDSEPVFSDTGVTRYQEYPVSEDLAVDQKEQDRARQDVSRELSQKIISLMTEGF
jgi:outer membrane lipopolysaccharide assembly protein LptE/RlpB